MPLHRYLSITFLLLLVTACGNSDTNSAPTVSIAEITEELRIGPDSAETARLEATVTDVENDSFSYQWSTVGSGASSVTFGTPTAEDTDITFSAPGAYTLQLVATDRDDSGSTGSDAIELTIEQAEAEPPSPQPAVIIAPDSPDTLTLSGGTATLDLSARLNSFAEGTPTFTWRSTSNDSSTAATFSPNGSTDAANTTATFTEAGTYRVTATASLGGDFTGEVNVTVEESSDN